MRFFALVAATALFALARASPRASSGIAARELLTSYAKRAPTDQELYVSAHCAELTPTHIVQMAGQPEISNALAANGVTVAQVIAYVNGVCST